jgi:hypothetical protein
MERLEVDAANAETKGAGIAVTDFRMSPASSSCGAPIGA